MTKMNTSRESVRESRRSTRPGTGTSERAIDGVGAMAPIDGAEAETMRSAEWDSEERERIDDRDAENIDLDTDCINEALERRGGGPAGW